ncbi:glycosyl transferase group 1 [Limnospira fusiformis CCALA 023]
MKVSLVVSDLSSSGAGRWGGGVRPFLLAKALQKMHYDVEIVGFCPPDQQGLISSTDVPIIAIPSYPSYPQFFASAQKLLNHITGDIIYAYKVKMTSLGLSWLKKLLNPRRKLILDIDDWELSWSGGDKWRYKPSVRNIAKDILKSDGAFRQPDHRVYLKWAENFVSKADAVTIHTQFLQNRFGGIYLPNGKDTDLFDPSLYNPKTSREKYGLSDYRILMFPGAPRPYKGVEDVLIALDTLNQPDLRLVIVGGSPYDDYDRQLTEKWGRWIIQLPKSSHTAMPEIVAAAHIVVVPQRETPATLAQFPLKLTDGMAMAKPIIATKVGDIPQILADTGYLVSPSSPSEIAEKIEFIFQHLPESAELGNRARQRCIKYYSIEAMTDILSNLMVSLSD